MIGGVRSDIKIGPITPRDVFKVLPFGNAIVVLHLKGEFLKQLFEDKLAGNRSGLAIGGGKLAYDRSKPDGEKITQFTIGGNPIDDNKEYRVATTDYLAEGNSGLSALASLEQEYVDQTGILLRDAVTQYIQKNTPLSIRSDGRWQKK